ncbi:helix-turn-helix transcriptional regulator [uncultured Pseudodesulfovibrio sp.]|uniref:helix-turn-helix domain-containing protein n=1 Tax=uncultured Pseudodesulfovibrio sp. TaxID=2035858 RepID=UPI0029C818D8|nr:helix-turn-helix transcriptional regulator [uncultured Pseudodesulfovibrio sp.]
MTSQFESIAHLGERLRAYRIGKNLTPEKVAQQAGISRAAIYRYESGQPIRVDVLGKIADLLQVSLESLLGVGVEYCSSALAFFERMRQLEETTEQLSVLFGPISYLLTTDDYDQVLADVLAESIPLDVDDREQSLLEIEKILKILKARKKSYRERKPHIISLISAAELEFFCRTGFVGCNNPQGVNLQDRIKTAKREVLNIIDLLREQPMGVQIGVLVDSAPGASFQIFKQARHSEVAVSPYKLGSFANVRIGVATISSAPESIRLHNDLTRQLWERSLKGENAVRYLRDAIDL